MGQHKPLKIGYVWQYEHVDFTQVSASVLHVKAVKRGLEKRGHHVRLITYRAGAIQWSDDLVTWHNADPARNPNRAFRLVESTVRGVQSRLRLPYFRLFESYHFAEACRSVMADRDIFYERHWLMASGGLMAAKRLGRPLIYEENGNLIEEYRQLGIHLSKAQWAAIRFAEQRMLHNASRIVAVSETLKKQTVENWRLDPAQVSVVDNGVEVDLFAVAEAQDALRAHYRLDHNPLVMFVGNFMPWHHLDVLVSAFSKVAAMNPAARLVLVGDGPKREEVEKQIGMLDLGERVICTGAVSHQDVAGLLSCASVAVLSHRPSTAATAGSPMKLFEYMAAGKAVVAPCLPNIERVVTDHETAMLVPPNDPEAMAGAILALLTDADLRQSLGQAARQLAVQKYSWDRAVGEIEAIMDELLAGPYAQPRLVPSQ